MKLIHRRQVNFESWLYTLTQNCPVGSFLPAPRTSLSTSYGDTHFLTVA